MKAAHLPERSTRNLFRRAALGMGVLLLSLWCVRAVAASRARHVLALGLAEAKAEQSAIRARASTRVLPAFGGLTHGQGDCVAAQRAVTARAPHQEGNIFLESLAWFPLTEGQIRAVDTYREQTAAMGDAATKCDRVIPESGDLTAWRSPLDPLIRGQMLLLDGRVEARDSDIETAGLRFLQGQRLGFELGLDDDVSAIVIGATVIDWAENALARLIAQGAPPALRERVHRELLALEPFLPDLPEAFRLHRADNAAEIARSVLAVPFGVDALLPATQMNCELCSFGQRIVARALPLSTQGSESLGRTKMETDAALRAFSDLNLQSLAKLDPLAKYYPIPNFGSLNVAQLAERHGRERLHVAISSALLRAVIHLAEVRDTLGRYPSDPKLPMDPLAPTKMLSYEVLPDGHYVLSSVGDGNSRDEWVIASRP